jgi:uncharacterized protein DUF4145
MPRLVDQLQLRRCPHCSVDTPMLSSIHTANTTAYDRTNARAWHVYLCRRCGGLVLASADHPGAEIQEIYPKLRSVDAAVPEKARRFLEQANESLHAPAGAVMLAASAVDAMLKAKEYKTGSLNARIEKAAKDHLITDEMSTWAHQVRLDANDQRHADESASLPTEADARRCIEFASALATFLFTLPKMVTRGIEESAPAVTPEANA